MVTEMRSMVFTSTVFLFLFFPLVLLIYYLPFLNGHRQFRNCLLFFSSLFFYAWGEPLFIFMLLLSIIITWWLGNTLSIAEGKSRKAILTLGISYHIGLLFVFKYLGFLIKEVGRLFSSGQVGIEIALPIGISFFTFQMMSYLFDVYYGSTKVQNNLLNLGLYVSFFPQLIAGPIVRYQTIERQIMERTETREDFEVGLKRFIFGAGKKVILADTLAVIADNIFGIAHVNGVSMLTGWIGAIAYTLQIYFDFSGYSDMAIGLGRCFGFHFNENFNQPYLADSVNDFWKRWHISLTDWFRDYVYIPLGGNRVGKSRQIRNTVIVWTLTGIWHGANWTFLVWGLVYCCFQLLEKHVYSPARWPKNLRHFYTLAIVCLCWVIFRAQSLGDALRYLADLFGRSGLTDGNTVYYAKNSLVVFALALFCCLLPLLQQRLSGLPVTPALRELLTYLLLVFILAIAIVFSIAGGYSPFIYFNF